MPLQMVFAFERAQPGPGVGPIPNGCLRFRPQADILMESDGAWAAGPTAERCLMRLAGKTVLLESRKDDVALPFHLDPNPSLVGWGVHGYGRFVIPDDKLGKAYVGRFGLTNLQSVTGKASAYTLTVIEHTPLQFPDFHAQAEVLERVLQAGPDIRALYRLRGAWVALEWKPQDPLVRLVQSQYLPVESVNLRDGKVRFSGLGWHAAFDRVTGWEPVKQGISLTRAGKATPVVVHLTHPMRLLDVDVAG